MNTIDSFESLELFDIHWIRLKHIIEEQQPFGDRKHSKTMSKLSGDVYLRDTRSFLDLFQILLHKYHRS